MSYLTIKSFDGCANVAPGYRVRLLLLPLLPRQDGMISRAHGPHGHVVASKAPEKTGAVQKLRHFDVYANLAPVPPSRESAAVPSAGFG